MANILNNTTSLQEVLEALQNKAAPGDVELPELTNEGTALDLMLSKELIDSDGNKVVGSFTIDNEINTQASLVSQIQTALQGKAGGGNSTGSLQYCTLTIQIGSNATLNQVIAKTNNGWYECFCPDTTSLVIENVQCNSMFYAYSESNGIYLMDKISFNTSDTENVSMYYDSMGLSVAFYLKGVQGGDYTMTIDYIEDTP